MSSTDLSSTDQTKFRLAFSLDVGPVPPFPFSRLKPQYNRPSWILIKQSYKPEKSMAGTAPTKHHVICYECYIQGHVASKYILTPLKQKLVTVNYETLSRAKTFQSQSPPNCAQNSFIALQNNRFQLYSREYFPIPEQCIQWAEKGLRKGPKINISKINDSFRFTTLKVSSKKAPSSE